MTIRMHCLAATAAIALTACGPTEEPAANVAMNDLNTLDTAIAQNAAVPETVETNVAAEPAAEASEPKTEPAPGPKKAAPAKPAAAPEPKAAEPAAPDPTCAPEHRAAGHC